MAEKTATAPAAETIAPVKPKVRQLAPARFHLAEHARNVWRVHLEDGTPFEDALRPEFWAHVAQKLKPFDKVEVLPDDGSYFAEVMVRACDRLWAHVALLRKVELGGPTENFVGADYELKFRGPQSKHAIVRKSDGRVLKDGFQTKELAARWAVENLRQLAA